MPVRIVGCTWPVGVISKDFEVRRSGADIPVEMVRRKIDNRIRVLIENGVTVGHRTMFVVVGEKAKDQVIIRKHVDGTCPSGLVSRPI